jgi:hypothetical protein
LEPWRLGRLHYALGERAGRYLLISSTSVYAEPAGPGFDESSPTVSERTARTPAAKALCW